MNSHIVNCLGPRPEPSPATARLRADTSPHGHASSGWGEAPLSMHRHRALRTLASAADRVFLDCRGAGILVRRAHRTGPVTPTVKLGAGHGAGVSRSAGRDALMPPRLEDG